MTTLSPTRPPMLDARVRAPLAALRCRLRLYVWGLGLSTTVACAGALFWASLFVDWFFEPLAVFRVVLLLAGLGTLAAVAVKALVRRLQVRLSDADMAMLLERRFTELDDTLLTAVELAGPRENLTVASTSDRTAEDGLHAEMLARTCGEAARRIGVVRPGAVFNPAPLSMSLVAAGLLSLSVAGFGVLAPQSMGIWARRSLLFSGELWPRRTVLAVEGFAGGVRKVARGANLEIVATADTNMPLVPNTVELRYETENGARGRKKMVRDGEAEPGRDRFQRYSYTFHGVLSPIDLSLRGGDARLDGLRIEVVPSPKIEEVQLVCEYPKYMDRSVRRVPVIGPMQVPRHTRVVVEGRVNKQLVDVRIDRAGEESAAEPVVLEPVDDALGGHGFRYPLGVLDNDVTLLVTLHDVDGIETAEPVRLVLAAAADQPPELAVTLSGIGTAITPLARLPVAGPVRDDHGIAEVWFEYAVGEGEATRKPLAAIEGNATEWDVDAALEVRDLNLEAGGKFTVALKASDRYDVQASPNVGTSQRWQLDVVTPDQLRTRLQARELTLRARFERIIQEVTETGDTLMRIPFGDDTKRAEKEAKPGAEGAKRTGMEPEDATAEPTGAEPGEPEPKAEPTPEDTRRRELAVRSLRCERAVQNCRKNANETLGVAEAFDDLRQELINNRIDTEELKNRLQLGIADPLREIAEKEFPELERLLLALREVLEDDGLAPARRDAAREQVEQILAGLTKVLDRMLEQEDFNEAIDMLREIIKMQKELEEQTRNRQKSQLRDLLEE